MKYRSVKDSSTGWRKQIEVPKRIKPWWFESESGKICVSIPYGAQLIELAKGKLSVEVASAEELVQALTAIKAAVQAGELGAQIETASSALKQVFLNAGYNSCVSHGSYKYPYANTRSRLHQTRHTRASTHQGNSSTSSTSTAACQSRTHTSTASRP